MAMKEKVKRIAINALFSLPAFIACFYASLPIENLHYGFPNPGIDFDYVGVVFFLSLLAFAYSAVLLFFRHKQKVDFLFPYLVFVFVVIRFFTITRIFEHYYF